MLGLKQLIRLIITNQLLKKRFPCVENMEAASTRLLPPAAETLPGFRGRTRKSPAGNGAEEHEGRGGRNRTRMKHLSGQTSS